LFAKTTTLATDESSTSASDLTVQEYRAASVNAADATENAAPVAPAMATPSFFHWYVTVPAAVTPTETIPG
jgi:hypothetical protein